jgi:hypothetical protein
METQEARRRVDNASTTRRDDRGVWRAAGCFMFAVLAEWVRGILIKYVQY